MDKTDVDNELQCIRFNVEQAVQSFQMPSTPLYVCNISQRYFSDQECMYSKMIQTPVK